MISTSSGSPGPGGRDDGAGVFEPIVDLDHLDDGEVVRTELAKFAREFVLFVSTRGEVLGSSSLVTLGYSEAESTGRHIGEYIHPDDLPKVFDVTERARRTPGFEGRLQARARHKNGTWHIFDVWVYDASLHTEMRGAVLRVRDITAELERQTPTDVSVDADRFASLAEMLPFGILSADTRGWVAYCNDAACKIFDLPANLIVGHGWKESVHELDHSSVTTAAADALASLSPRQVTFRVATGLFQRWAHAKFVPMVSDSGKAAGWIATIEDVTDRHRAESELAHRATHDSLTKLPNRTLLEDRLRQSFGRLRRDASSVTVLFIDLDRFKGINDSHGHQTGDAVLIEAAGRLRKIIGEIDTVARLGGDEFVAVCESLGADEAMVIAERIRESLGAPMLVGDTPLRIGASVGVAITHDPIEDPMSLLELADQAMYRNKEDRKRDRPD